MVLRNVMTTPFTCGVHASVASRMRNRFLLVGSSVHRGSGVLGDLLPVQNRELSVRAFHERGKTLDPVAIVAIQNAADPTNLRLVDVAAHDTVGAASPCFLRKGDLEVG